MKRTLSLILAALLLAGGMLSSCSGGTAETTAAETVETAPVETEPELTGRAAVRDNIPADFTMNGATTAIFCMCTAENPNCYVVTDEQNGDVVQDARYDAARTVENRLNVKFNMIGSASGWSDFGKEVESGVLAGLDDWNIVFIRSNSAVQGGRDYLFRTLNDDAYIDLDQPWWWDATMTLALDGTSVRYLIGDNTMDHLEQSGAMYVNTTLYETVYGDPENFYKMVLDRKWTHDKLAELCEGAYKDVNGDGKMDTGDVLGLYCGDNEMLRHAPFTTGIRSYTRSAEGFPVVDYDVDRASKTVDSFNRLFWSTRGGLYDGGTSYDSAKAAACKLVFSAGNVLFYCARLGTYGSFRDMEDDYGIIPYPMLDLEQGEYANTISNSDTFVTVPITCPNPNEVGAVIELLAAEGYRQVLDAFYDKALKLKYSRDSYTAECIDIIHNVTIKEFFNDYSSMTGSPFSIQANLYANTNTVASDYAGKKESIDAKIVALVDNYKKLAEDLK